jgi:protein ImuA
LSSWISLAPTIEALRGDLTSPPRNIGPVHLFWMILWLLMLALRRWRRQAQAAEFVQPTASTTRWRVGALPSTPLPVPGIGRARWRLELLRCRRGESAEFQVEACDAQGRVALPAEMTYRSTLAKRRKSIGSL